MTRRERPLVRLLYFLVTGPSVLMQGCSSSSNSDSDPNPNPALFLELLCKSTSQVSPPSFFDHFQARMVEKGSMGEMRALEIEEYNAATKSFTSNVYQDDGSRF